MTAPADHPESPRPDDTQPTHATTPADPAAEVREAMSHLRRAAAGFLERAQKDPAVQYAVESAGPAARRVAELTGSMAGDASEVILKAGQAAEPIAEKVVEELGRVGQRLFGFLDGSKTAPKSPPGPDESEK